jgi:hypothetical protein
MLDELDRDGEGLQAETGFGTGLRAHILGLHEEAEHDALPEPTLPPLPHPEPDPALLELEQIRLRLERKDAALGERERSLNVQAQAVAAEAKRLADQKAELERHLDVRDLLRRRAEEEVERLWRTFDDALEATRAGGEPDFEVRLAAARALLAEAYAAPGADATDPAALPDELAVLRDRKGQLG